MYTGSDRPRIKIGMNSIDWLFEFIAFALIVIHILLLVFYYSDLPGTIPTHFNGAGDPDGYGSKTTLFLIPAFSVFIYLSLTIAAFFPHIYNFPVKITEQNAEIQYRLAIRFLRAIKVLVLLMFAFINYRTVLIALGSTTGLGVVFLPVFLLLFFGVIALYFVQALNNRFPG